MANYSQGCGNKHAGQLPNVLFDLYKQKNSRSAEHKQELKNSNGVPGLLFNSKTLTISQTQNELIGREASPFE